MVPKKLKVVFKPKADRQILNIMIYIATKGYPERSVKFSDKLYEFGYSLGILPEKYPVCRQKQLAKRKMRCAVFKKNYIFVYKPVKHQLIIYNIIHCKTNPAHYSA